MIKLILVLLMILSTVVSFIVWGVNGIRLFVMFLKKNECCTLITLFKKCSIVFVAVLVVSIAIIWISQLTVSTPAIKDASGKVVEGSVAKLKTVTLNGRKEWITIRGNDKNAPILLFLAGGPGGSQLAATRFDLKELEKHFVVVNWDQPGSAKSLHCMKSKDLTTQTYIDDGLALTEYLCKEFNKEQIYLVGESWGSALGIFMAKERPERFEGMIGAGQMVDFEETDKICYHTALDLATEKGDSKVVKSLEKEGEPIYTTGNLLLRSWPYLNYLSNCMMSNPNTSGGFHTIRDVTASEYGIRDAIDYAVGLVQSFNQEYPQLYGVDLRKDYADLKVPVYLFLGRYDVNAPTSLAEEYYNKLQAPKKELVWFEHSGHTPWQFEPDRFCKELLRVYNME